MSKIIGNPLGKSVLDEMIDNTREANAEFLKEIEKEKLEAERKAREEPYKAPVKAVLYVPEKEEPEKPAEGVVINAPGRKESLKRRVNNHIGNFIGNHPAIATYSLIGSMCLGLFSAVFIPLRIYKEYDYNSTNYTAECVVAERAVGFWGRAIQFRACNDGSREITDQGSVLADSDGNGTVDEFVDRGYTFIGPNAMPAEAYTMWKEDWEELGADEILKGWQEWKERQR